MAKRHTHTCPMCGGVRTCRLRHIPGLRPADYCHECFEEKRKEAEERWERERIARNDPAGGVARRDRKDRKMA